MKKEKCYRIEHMSRYGCCIETKWADVWVYLCFVSCAYCYEKMIIFQLVYTKHQWSPLDKVLINEGAVLKLHLPINIPHCCSHCYGKELQHPESTNYRQKRTDEYSWLWDDNVFPPSLTLALFLGSPWCSDEKEESLGMRVLMHQSTLYVVLIKSLGIRS